VRIATTVSEARGWVQAGSRDIGLVPTMGYLHAGHLALVERARRENERLAVSLFVNPTQFGPTEDLGRYPRDLDRDRELLAEAGCDLLFAPTAAEMYPQGHATAVDVGPLAARLEGERRPGHFRGVATVVLKLFGILQPRRAYFGQKDAQQLGVVRALVRDLDLAVEVIGCPTVREADGLALSSRNAYLSAEERRAAPVLYRALLAARERWAAGERGAEGLRSAMRRALDAEPLARTDYVSVADPRTFSELETLEGPALVSLAVFLGRTRLIDNVVLDPAAVASPVRP
jgi:pantoate--beta-alanine ligase